MPSGQAWIGTSWKMNKTLGEALAFVEGLRRAAAPPGIRRFVIPPFTAVREVKAALVDTDVLVGAQNVHWEAWGAWTGEISAPMLVDCGADLVEIGHSERRRHFGETDATVGLKVQAALEHGLIPLVCVGEMAKDKAAGRVSDVLKYQIDAAFSHLGLGDLVHDGCDRPVLLAYEPVWAIGEDGTAASPGYADERHAAIKEVAEGVTGRRLPCLYGGSVDSRNCVDLIASSHVDGLFIGRAALAVERYLEIVRLSACGIREQGVNISEAPPRSHC